MATNATLERARRLLCSLQDGIRDTLRRARATRARTFARIAGQTSADTIYQVDRLSEAAILAWFEEHWPRAWPVELVMEGIEDGHAVTFPSGTPVARTEWKCILDPIDGTRGIMYDKRPAWSLAGLAPQRGPRTTIRDVVVAAMTELPTSKQWRSDQVSAVRGRGIVSRSFDVRTGRSRVCSFRPSQARHFRHGFSAFAHFFPDGKTLLAELEEAFWANVEPTGKGPPLIFDDQYISTGGQFYEILAGHDRFIADLRPLAFQRLGLNSALVCHPYDVCTELILREAGGIVEKPLGGAIDTPLDTTSPVSWVAFANPHLAEKARPVLRRLIRKLL